MLRHLYLLRHAKSLWAQAAQEKLTAKKLTAKKLGGEKSGGEKANLSFPMQQDFDRPLNPRGQTDAQALARYISANKTPVSHALISPAKRTVETWQRIRPALPVAQVMFEDQLYLASPETLIALIHGVADNATHLMVIGHNPGLEMLAKWIATPTSDGDALQNLWHKFPTCGLASFTLTGASWTVLGKETARLVDFSTPKDRRP